MGFNRKNSLSVLLIQKILRRNRSMNYTTMTEADIEQISTLYMNYYNNYEGGC